jgi:hypothetical protein
VEIARFATRQGSEASNTPDDELALQEAAACFGLDMTESLQEQAESYLEQVCEVWPEHWDALRLYLACRSQLEMALGGMGGVVYMAARSVNVQQELRWLGLPRSVHAITVVLYRAIEVEAVNLINEQANRKA